MAPVALTRTQESARGRNDDGNELLATWKANADTAYTQLTGTNFRHRILLQLTTSQGNNNTAEQWQYSLGGGTWTNITSSSSVVKGTASAHYTSPDDTTQQVGAGTFVTTNSGLIESGGAGPTTVPDMDGNDECEFEGCFQIVEADVSDGNTIRLRLIEDSDELENYNSDSLFDITVSIPAAAARRLFTVT